MFNMYQELVDKINELLKQNRKQAQLIRKLKNLYVRISYSIINELCRNEVITEDELHYWFELRRSFRDKENNK